MISTPHAQFNLDKATSPVRKFLSNEPKTTK